MNLPQRFVLDFYNSKGGFIPCIRDTKLNTCALFLNTREPYLVSIVISLNKFEILMWEYQWREFKPCVEENDGR